METFISVTANCDKVTVESTGMAEVIAHLHNASLGDVLADVDVNDVIDFYGMGDILKVIDDRRRGDRL